jgi:YegS/Rv2252/BmrU family lipid kinase
MKLRLIFNPMAGRGRARQQIGKVLARLRERGADVDCVSSTSPADLTRIAAESSRDGWDRVVVCGGDGTLHLAVREFDLHRGTLALLPLGTGDDFARAAGIPRTVNGACDAILNGKMREVDVATANGLRYLGVAGLGFDSEVARYASENVQFLRGSLVYLYSILRVLPRFTPHRVRIDGIRTEQIMFACVGNTPQYGGGIRITPNAQIDDGLLDLCLVLRTTRAQLLKTLPRAYTGSHVKSPFVETARATQFTFESDRPMDVYADGERLTSTPVTFALAREKLRIVVP